MEWPRFGKSFVDAPVHDETVGAIENAETRSRDAPRKKQG